MTKSLSAKARTFLQERRFAVLATINPDGSPQLSAMWYLLEDEHTILMNTEANRIKARNIRRDPRVSVCFEDGGYLTISGTVELIDDPDIAQRDIYRLAARYDGEEQARKQMEVYSKEQRVSLRIRITNIVENI
ncbi:PPOX class probable F420-dependent enzyme [Thermosporothrix hazakensis]|jgi:PPOX class probable F420-dependent enzyme|uniref:PPOX class F420-dependent enzyme n=2 Tax=Thermosporothrix TaxID=768650 RepID=A0A455SSX0_9CHLR|nr:PPOX class F420-dependent oxidoreductase [Thermosporothrix hazakensis]PZW32080.1 PPOX class probable F420-dependent enzyme [Thermosporothrix hazakensis]BBH91447.1 PPOX class F420-dependent enzyme [Thermosporothrix sp. COM3]GCE49592.1 PPOX class F420-dependent enzyme [Thermosporothrix hazakensis]